MYSFFFCQAEDGIRDLVRSRGLGDVYKRQDLSLIGHREENQDRVAIADADGTVMLAVVDGMGGCLLYTSDAADERSSVDLGGRRIIKKKNRVDTQCHCYTISKCVLTKTYRRGGLGTV